MPISSITLPSVLCPSLQRRIRDSVFGRWEMHGEQCAGISRALSAVTRPLRLRYLDQEGKQ